MALICAGLKRDNKDEEKMRQIIQLHKDYVLSGGGNVTEVPVSAPSVKKDRPPICVYCVYVGHGDYGYYCISIEGCAMD